MIIELNCPMCNTTLPILDERLAHRIRGLGSHFDHKRLHTYMYRFDCCKCEYSVTYFREMTPSKIEEIILDNVTYRNYDNEGWRMWSGNNFMETIIPFNKLKNFHNMIAFS